MRKAKLPAITDYAVGYRKPPQQSRFQKGQSGNSRGRRKGSKNSPSLGTERLKNILLEEAYRPVTIRDESGPVSIPVAQAIIRSMALKAAQGNLRAQEMIMSTIHAVEAEQEAQKLQAIINAAEYQEKTREHIESCKRNKLPEPEIYPHPDHVDINLNTGEVTIRGPISKADKNVWDMIWDMKATHEDGIKILCDELKKTRPNSRNWRTLNEEIKSCQFQLRFLKSIYGKPGKSRSFTLM